MLKQFDCWGCFGCRFNCNMQINMRCKAVSVCLTADGHSNELPKQKHRTTNVQTTEQNKKKNKWNAESANASPNNELTAIF